MPELPEVETIRRAILPALVGARIGRARLLRAGVLTGPATPGALLQSRTVAAVERHGKQLALIAEPGRPGGRAPVLVVHLGMTGRLILSNDEPSAPHTHALWRIEPRAGGGAITMAFIDPRRFGGLWALPSVAALRDRWGALGPDALDPPPHPDPRLERLWRSRSPVKAALLNQSFIAGVGNIYADEALFRARVHPMRPAHRLSAPSRRALIEALRVVLSEAVEAGGSTLRDYALPSGDPGAFQFAHRVYGRAGLPCTACRAPLRGATVAQRTTTWCPRCQPRR